MIETVGETAFNMKVKLIIIAAALFVSQSSTAQGLRLGIKGGTTVSKLSGQSFSEKFEYGYHIGGFVNVKIGPKWSIQPEVLFNQINTTVDSSFKSLYSSLYNPSYVKNVKLKYLTIPLVVNYKLNRFMSLQAGPQYGILMDNNKNLFQNGREAFSKGDFSMLGGLQLNFGKISVAGRYVVGLNNLNDIDNRDKWRSQSAQISLGLAF
jgi:hypothetical protein